MFRRLPTFLSLTFATTLGLFALTSVLTAQPTPPPTATGPGAKRTQEENLKFYKNFAEQVLRLAQKWEKSDSPEDKERAKSLRAALKIADEKGVEKLFKELIEGLNGKSTNFQELFGKDKKLVDALKEILTILESEDNDAARRARSSGSKTRSRRSTTSSGSRRTSSPGRPTRRATSTRSPRNRRI